MSVTGKHVSARYYAADQAMLNVHDSAELRVPIRAQRQSQRHREDDSTCTPCALGLGLVQGRLRAASLLPGLAGYVALAENGQEGTLGDQSREVASTSTGPITPLLTFAGIDTPLHRSIYPSNRHGRIVMSDKHCDLTLTERIAPKNGL